MGKRLQLPQTANHGEISDEALHLHIILWYTFYLITCMCCKDFQGPSIHLLSENCGSNTVTRIDSFPVNV